MSNHYSNASKALKQPPSKPQQSILTMIIRLILQVIILGSLVIFGLSLIASCQPSLAMSNEQIIGGIDDKR